MPVANESGTNTQPWRTPASILNHELWVPPVRTQLTELSYSTLKSLTFLSGIQSLVRSNHNAGRLRQSNAARRSTNAAKVGWPKFCLHCAIFITQGCYAITRRAARRESALLRMSVWQRCWFDSCKDDMCKHLPRHGKQSYPSIIATLRLGSFSFIQRDHDALVPFLRNHFFWVTILCNVCRASLPPCWMYSG